MTSLYLVPCPSWWCLSGYGACVPTTPEVPAVPQRKLGTQASGAFLEKNPPPCPYYYLIKSYDMQCVEYAAETHLNINNCRQTCRHHCLLSKMRHTDSYYLLESSHRNPDGSNEQVQYHKVQVELVCIFFFFHKWDNVTSYQNMLMLRKRGSGTFSFNRVERSYLRALQKVTNNNYHHHRQPWNTHD